MLQSSNLIRDYTCLILAYFEKIFTNFISILVFSLCAVVTCFSKNFSSHVYLRFKSSISSLDATISFCCFLFSLRSSSISCCCFSLHRNYNFTFFKNILFYAVLTTSFLSLQSPQMEFYMFRRMAQAMLEFRQHYSYPIKQHHCLLNQRSLLMPSSFLRALLL